jgi:large conductance mechanosensitive channel
MRGFKDFIMRGNLVELAVAFIIATSFALVVTAFVGFIMSIVSAIFGGPPNFDDVAPGGILIGPVITALISFVIIAAVVYFLVVTPYTKLQERRAAGQEEEPAALSGQEMLLQEIRDLLAADTTGRTGTDTTRTTRTDV